MRAEGTEPPTPLLVIERGTFAHLDVIIFFQNELVVLAAAERQGEARE